MSDIYSTVASLCGFVEESTDKSTIIAKAKKVAKLRQQNLYLESLVLEEDEKEEEDEGEDKVAILLEKIAEKLGVEIEEDEEEESEDEEIELEEEEEQIDSGAGDDLEEEDCKVKEESKRYKNKALAYLKRRKEDLILESIQLEEDRRSFKHTSKKVK
jgi:hypothetical protein